MRTSSSRGFTLVEIMVASAVLALFMVGILNLLDTSTKISQVESELADTQENVRFATYHIMRTARMIGGGGMPVAGANASGNHWVSAELISNASSSSLMIPGYDQAVSVLPGSDVLTLRGFFEISPLFTHPESMWTGASELTVSETNLAGEPTNDLGAFTAGALVGRGLVFMGKGKYNTQEVEVSYTVGEITSASLEGEAPNRRLVLTYGAGDALWPDLNVDGAVYPPATETYRVGVLESYTYYVDDRNVLMRLRLTGSGAPPEPVAVNIGGFQVALGVDTTVGATDDGISEITTWVDNPADASAVINADVLAMRITVLGRTTVRVPNWEEPIATFQVEDGTASGLERSAKWRRMQVVVNLRNYTF
jgi:prepilin-type N-terminal cleavage/methylation domain-containing protein